MLKVIPLSSLVKVFSDEEPKQKPFNKLSMFRNEKASLQIAFSSDVDSALTLSVASALGSAVRFYLVEEIYSGLAVGKPQDDYTLRGNGNSFPDLLRPICDNTLKAEAGKWYSIWVEVVPDECLLPSGEHIVAVELCDGKDKKSVELIFDVIDGVLPEQKLIYTNWFHTDCLATHYGVKVFSEKYWEIVENYLRVAREYGMNMALTPIFTPPLDTKIGKERETVQLVGVKVDNGKYIFDFSKVDRWLEMCDRVGIEYYEISHLTTQWGAKKCPKIVADADGVEKKIFGWNTRASGRKYREFLTAFAGEFKRYIYAKGIENKVYFHVSDEPFIAVLGSYRKASELIKGLFGEFKIIDALSDYRFYQRGLIDLPIPSNDHIERFIDNVPELWTYYCGAQFKKVSNRFFSMPSQRNRIIGYQMYKYKVKGFLHWGYNYWYTRFSLRKVDPFKESDAGGSFPSGDSYVVYPGDDGKPLQSLRLKVFNDALQDMRALEMAESLIGREKTMEILEKGVETPITFAEYPHSDEWQLLRREEINSAIREAMGK